jgi:predicted ArsR family transcriptional regulator
MPTPDADLPSEFDLATGFASALDSEPADERVYRVALQLYEPTRVAAIAERADCAPDTARRHLARLVDIGVLKQIADAPATYQRNESYFEWRTRSRLEQLSMSQLQERLEELTGQERELQDRYDANHPDDVDALDHAEYDQIEEVWLDLSEWETVRRRIRRLEDIRQQRAADSESKTA